MSRLEKTFRAAMAHHNSGRLSQAEALYRTVIAQQPRHSQALYLLGLLLHQRGAHQEAVDWLRQAIAARPKPSAEWYVTLGTALGVTGDRAGAVRCYSDALGVQPDYLPAHQNLGRIALAEDRLDDAAQHFARALTLAPRDAAAHHDMAVVLMRRNLPSQAISYLQEAVKLDPKHAPSWNNLGNALRAQGRLEESISCLRQAVALQPTLGPAINNLGAALQAQSHLAGNPDLANEALDCFRKATEIDPVYPEAWGNLGNALKLHGRVREGIGCVRKALQLAPEYGSAYSNLSAMLYDTGDLDEALACGKKAVALQPRDASAWSNLGNVFKSRCALRDAIFCYEKALLADPAFAIARWNLAMVLFMAGDIARAWKEFESGWASGQRGGTRPFTQPWWDGSALSGRKLLVWGEQGVGDEIIFSAMAAELGPAAVLECDPRLVALFRRSLPVREVIARSNPPDSAAFQPELQTPLGSLGQWLRPSLDRFPAHRGYLRADTGRVRYWLERLDALGAGLKVGICWRSSCRSGIRGLASTELLEWEPVLRVPGVHFINLEYDECAPELASAEAAFAITVQSFAGLDLRNDLGEVAALTSALDLVISSATAVANLAGALGKPVWVLALTSVANWYTMGQDYIPWFPSARVYWRSWDRPWDSALRHVALDLADFARQSFSAPPPALALAP